MNRPRVVVHSAASIDGRISLGPNRTGFEDMADSRSKAILPSDETDDERGRRLLSLYKPQVFLEGSSSFVRENDDLIPLPAFEGNPEDLYRDYLPDDVIHKSGQKGWFAAVDGRGRLRFGVKEFAGWNGWHVLHLTSFGAPAEYLAFLQSENIPYLIAGEQRVDLPLIMEKLKSILNVKCVLSTAGGRLNGALLRSALVDEINIEFSPSIIGGFQTPSLFDSPDLKAEEQPTQLKLVSAQIEDGTRMCLRYEVCKD